MDSVTTQLEILDLRHFTARELRPLLEAEALAWEERLLWNYHSATELLLQYLDSRILPGFVALDHGRIYGYCFAVYEGHKAVIGDAWSERGNATLARHSTVTLLRHLFELLTATPGIDRIESQLLLYDAGALDEPFVEAGFAVYPRLFMQLDLPARTALFSGNLPAELEILPWSQDYYEAAAALIHDAYTGHIDASINDQYCSLHGSQRFLHNIIRFPGCGVFAADQSWVLRHKGTGNLVGLLLASRVGVGISHITQLCIAQAWQGHALGATLLTHAVSRLAGTQAKAITLTVSEANRSAVNLYARYGFFTRHRFDAMVYDRGKKE
ncbi:MAG: GNAT family N-acetyltransferase [Acidobacteriaceae bacterium]|nr:GNAT family N-acetyltransferase [Acidobacteriaceae bacterium]